MKLRRHDFHMVILKFHGMMTFQTIASYGDSVHEFITIKWLHAIHKEGDVLGLGKFSIAYLRHKRIACGVCSGSSFIEAGFIRHGEVEE
jgi:hypothetical protein